MLRGETKLYLREPPLICLRFPPASAKQSEQLEIFRRRRKNPFPFPAAAALGPENCLQPAWTEGEPAKLLGSRKKLFRLDTAATPRP